MSEQRNIVIVGGGPSGLMAAIIAARSGARVQILERMPRVGKKLLATGAGRCNLCNSSASVKNYHGADTSFIQPALDFFGDTMTRTFFEHLGIEVREAPGGRIFPVTGQAANVLDVLRFETERLGVVEICDVKVQQILPIGGAFRCECQDGQVFKAHRVIIATGGQSMPNLGSNGGGYKLAKALGHELTPCFPARVQLRLDAWFLKRLKGMKVVGLAEALVDGVPQRHDEGDLLFTDYGISGPPILQISRSLSKHERENRRLEVRLDLMPHFSLEELEQRLQERFNNHPTKPLEVSFIGFFHKRLIPVVLREAGQEDVNRLGGDLSAACRTGLSPARAPNPA
jgi:predicted Rossmann fold flavoprotein